MRYGRCLLCRGSPRRHIYSKTYPIRRSHNPHQLIFVWAPTPINAWAVQQIESSKVARSNAPSLIKNLTRAFCTQKQKEFPGKHIFINWQTLPFDKNRDLCPCNQRNFARWYLVFLKIQGNRSRVTILSSHTMSPRSSASTTQQLRQPHLFAPLIQW